VTPPRTTTRRRRSRTGAGPPDARVIKAIGHPLRWQMLEALNEDEASPAQLARRFGEPVNLVAYHMSILLKAGGVELVRTVPRRGSTEHYYRAIMRPFFGDREWARLPAETRRAVLETEIKRVVRDVRAAAAGTGLDHPKVHVSWTPLELDREGMDEVATLLVGVVDELVQIQARVNSRQTEKGGRTKSESLSTEVAMLHFERSGRRAAGQRRRSRSS
jgi:DNA-binding transcriptional ArsR family regulator